MLQLVYSHKLFDSSILCFVHRYVNGHAKKHYEENQVVGVCPKKCDKPEKEKHPHSVCMDCSNYSVFW